MKDTIKNNIFGGKITTGLGAVVAIFSLLGLNGDPATSEAVQQFLTANANTIAQIVAVVALLFARDPQVPGRLKNNDEVLEETSEREKTIREILARIKTENPT